VVVSLPGSRPAGGARFVDDVGLPASDVIGLLRVAGELIDAVAGENLAGPRLIALALTSARGIRAAVDAAIKAGPSGAGDKGAAHEIDGPVDELIALLETVQAIDGADDAEMRAVAPAILAEALVLAREIRGAVDGLVRSSA